MRWLVVGMLALHGLIHAMGFAFGFAELPQLALPISRAIGVAWLRFSTPVRDYRAFGPVRLMGFGEARWRLPEGEFVYGEFELQDVTMNLPPR